MNREAFTRYILQNILNQATGLSCGSASRSSENESEFFSPHPSLTLEESNSHKSTNHHSESLGCGSSECLLGELTRKISLSFSKTKSLDKSSIKSHQSNLTRDPPLHTVPRN